MVIRRKRSFRRKKRVSPGTWFPINGTLWNDGEDTYSDVAFTGNTGNVSRIKAQGAASSYLAVTADYTFDKARASATGPVENQPSLRDYVEGQDYILKRLVGNLNLFALPDLGDEVWQANQFWTYVNVAAGFFIARAQDDAPAFPDLTFAELDPQDSSNTQNPWIWRRNWILANPRNQVSLPNGTDPVIIVSDEVSSNRTMPDLSGPHIDTKSMRRVRREERLWFAISAVGWDGVRGDVSAPTLNQPSVDYHLDIRLFGKMAKGKNSSTF